MILLAAAVSSFGDGLTTVFDAETGFQINLFWVVTQAATFLIFLAILYFVAFRRIGGVLEERRSRIEQGLRDADAARQERERAAEERLAVLAAARTEAQDVLARSQKVADESRERDLAETRAEIERLRERATADIEAERLRALADVRDQVADLALLAAGRVINETMSDDRQRRLVDEFLGQVAAERGTRGRGSTGRGA
ncbi:MAG TPA: F0F1 ATP synthase subunit B [Candidatus Limnocylindrales bacterium]|jgi:F-type H+-transporting ATPase subunit b|nr:F0F1 ATP synthase subunit B [Candidatus Limnocylindrales bacterium]